MASRACRCACIAALSGLLAACGSKSPSAPDGNAAAAELRVAGLVGSLSPGATVQLRAELVALNGTITPCSATWAVDDPKVAVLAPSGALTAAATGYFTVTASCEGHTAAIPAKVEALSPYNLIIAVFDNEVPSEFGIDATMEFLDGARAGQRLPVGSIYTSGIAGVVWPVKVRITAENYQPRDLVVAESTGNRRNPDSSLFDFRIPMTFVPDASTDTYVRSMSSAQMELAHPFTMRAAGRVAIRTWWSVDYNDGLTISLWCGGQLLRSAALQFGSAGGGFTEEVPRAGACEVRLRQLKSDAGTRYRVAITYPR